MYFVEPYWSHWREGSTGPCPERHWRSLSLLLENGEGMVLWSSSFHGGGRAVASWCVSKVQFLSRGISYDQITGCLHLHLQHSVWNFRACILVCGREKCHVIIRKALGHVAHCFISVITALEHQSWTDWLAQIIRLLPFLSGAFSIVRGIFLVTSIWYIFILFFNISLIF